MAKISDSPRAHARFKSPADRLFDTFNIVFMICLMIVTLYPFINTLAVSFNNATDSVKAAFIYGRGISRGRIINMYLTRPRYSTLPSSRFCVR